MVNVKSPRLSHRVVYSRVEDIPVMVLLIRGLTRSAERIVEDDAVLNFWEVEPSPAADFLILSPSFLPLIRQQLRSAVPQPVVVRLSDSHD